MFRLVTAQEAGVLSWLKGLRYGGGDKPTAEAGKLRTCYLRGGPLDGDELQVEGSPPRLSVEKHYPVAAPRVEAYEGMHTRTHRYRMMQPCSDGFIYVYDGSA